MRQRFGRYVKESPQSNIFVCSALWEVCFQSLQLVRPTLGQKAGERREELIDISEWQHFIKKNPVNWAECGQTYFVLALGHIQTKQDLAPEFNPVVCVSLYVFVRTCVPGLGRRPRRGFAGLGEAMLVRICVTTGPSPAIYLACRGPGCVSVQTVGRFKKKKKKLYELQPHFFTYSPML